MNTMFMVKYGELSLKGNNKKSFIKRLVKNIEDKLVDIDYQLDYNYSRIFIKTNEESKSKVIDVLSKTFGIYSFSEVIELEKDLDLISDKFIEVLKEKELNTFKVECRRADKSFPINSMEISRIVGANILKELDLKVDLHKPDLKCFIEIRKDFAYIYTNSFKGLGGFPQGMQQKALVMLSGGIDSPVASFLMMKKGVEVDFIYFESPPHTSVEARKKVIKLANKISEYTTSNMNLFIVPFTKIQEAIYRELPHDYGITIMRRYMYRISEKIARYYNHLVLVNGESVGQVASQTLSSIVAIEDVVDIPVIRPLATYDKEEIIKISKAINTYETSILPYDDCCTLFVPKHPVINPRLDKCLEYESYYDFDTLLDKAFDDTKQIKIPYDFDDKFSEFL